MSRIRHVQFAALAAAGLLLTACASTPPPPPDDAISHAEQSIDRAQQAGAAEFAALEFTKARRKLDRARELSGSDEDEDLVISRRLAQQAAVDARVSEAKARLASTRQNYQQMEKTVESLRQEAGVNNGGGTP